MITNRLSDYLIPKLSDEETSVRQRLAEKFDALEDELSKIEKDYAVTFIDARKSLQTAVTTIDSKLRQINFVKRSDSTINKNNK